MTLAAIEKRALSLGRRLSCHLAETRLLCLLGFRPRLGLRRRRAITLVESAPIKRRDQFARASQPSTTSAERATELPISHVRARRSLPVPAGAEPVLSRAAGRSRALETRAGRPLLSSRPAVQRAQQSDQLERAPQPMPVRESAFLRTQKGFPRQRHNGSSVSFHPPTRHSVSASDARLTHLGADTAVGSRPSDGRTRSARSVTGCGPGSKPAPFPSSSWPG